jgi:hypothetical protein
MSAVAPSEDAWVDGWNAGVGAAVSVLSASDLPIEIRDHALALVARLLTD